MIQGIFICLLILVIFNLIKFVLAFLSPKPIQPISFENDIIFLNFLISKKLEDAYAYNLEASKITNGNSIRLFNDKDLAKNAERIIVEINFELSNNYKKVLLKYFSEEGLLDYITREVTNKLTAYILKNNGSQIRTWNRHGVSNNNEDIKKVSQRSTDI